VGQDFFEELLVEGLKAKSLLAGGPFRFFFKRRALIFVK